MIQVKIETGLPNWHFIIQREGDRLNVIMNRDMIAFSLVVPMNDFREALNYLCMLEEDANV